MTQFTWDPEDYERHSAQQERWARELVAKLQLAGDETVLDIGCGDGKVTAEIASRVPEGRVLGIDSSTEKNFSSGLNLLRMFVMCSTFSL